MTQRLTITRRATFAAAHRLFRPDWSDEHNLEVFGPCANPGGHGHNYVLEVTIGGSVDPDTGMIADLKWLKQVMEKHVIDLVDHRNLNADVQFLDGLNPTAENLACAFWRQLTEPVAEQAKLVRVVVIETENNRACVEDV
jgi:6-pyruvoyltetrahydropterin/6-carboxytetrahydropterin synthase